MSIHQSISDILYVEWKNFSRTVGWDVLLLKLRNLEVGLPSSGAKYMISYKHSNGKRYSCKTGRFLKKQFGELFNDQSILRMGTRINVKLWISDGKIKILEGEELRDFYNIQNSEINSCMSYPEKSHYLDIYVDNPEVVKLVTINEPPHAARALLWHHNGERYIDRAYYTSDVAAESIESWAKTNNIGDLFKQAITVDIKLNKKKNPNELAFPYMDTMSYLTITGEYKATLSSSSKKKYTYYLDLTEGDYGPLACHKCHKWKINGLLQYHSKLNMYLCSECTAKEKAKKKLVPKSTTTASGGINCSPAGSLPTRIVYEFPLNRGPL